MRSHTRPRLSWARPVTFRSLLIAGAVALTAAACGGDSTGPGDTTARLRIENAAEHNIWYLRTRACGTATWGSDLLGSDVLFMGTSQTFDVAAGCQDVKASTDPDLNGEVIWSGVNLEAGKTDTLKLTAWQYTQ